MALDVIHYENLTWPEVAALSRDLPLVLPLGDGYSVAAIAEAVRSVALVILPALPYGWRGSLVDVGADMLRRVVAGIFTAMHGEGFSRLCVVHGGEEDLDMLGVHHLKRAPEKPAATIDLRASPERSE